MATALYEVRKLVTQQRASLKHYAESIALLPTIDQMRERARNLPEELRRENLIRDDMVSYIYSLAISEVATLDERTLRARGSDGGGSPEAGVRQTIREALDDEAPMWEAKSSFRPTLAIDGP